MDEAVVEVWVAGWVDVVADDRFVDVDSVFVADFGVFFP